MTFKTDLSDSTDLEANLLTLNCLLTGWPRKTTIWRLEQKP